MEAFVFINNENNEANIYMTDGGVASIYHNGQHLITDYYQNRIPLELLPEDMSTAEQVLNTTKTWEDLAEGKMYYNDWKGKDIITEEIVQDAVDWLCVGCETKINFYYDERKH